MTTSSLIDKLKWFMYKHIDARRFIQTPPIYGRHVFSLNQIGDIDIHIHGVFGIISISVYLNHYR